MKKRYSMDSGEMNKLRQEIEGFVGRRLSSPADFDYLARRIQEADCGYVSPTTLKRIWGYINDIESSYSPSAYTLRALCNLLGYQDMEEFSSVEMALESKEYTGTFVESRTLPGDAIVQLCWHPNRKCTLRHMTDTLFEVTSSEHARLKAGDIVECGCFTRNAPVYFNRVFRNGASPLTYIAGSANGVTFTISNPGQGNQQN
ncbi:MAG: hypothetical protein K2M39_05795 [Muribaculaceae bacterium]|nr:hypothetical protein [Muribaculaceae bacterium]